jgi:CDGSH-type Zn-finger protein
MFQYWPDAVEYSTVEFRSDISTGGTRMSKDNSPKIVITKNGPYVVTGSVPLAEQTSVPHPGGGSSKWRQGATFEASATYALCRCGRSANAPFCDGTHAKVGFDGTETASHEPYDAQKAIIDGPDVVLEDVRDFCAVARFCDAGRNTWDAMEDTGEPATRAHVESQVRQCPSGRLVLRDKVTGAALEPELPISIGVVEDPAAKCSGPLWVRGGIPIESQGGDAYEVRNRVTLCRCGLSKNKPFCDASHVDAGYNDGRV